MKNNPKIDVNILVQKRINCIKNLDPSKVCETCAYGPEVQPRLPCTKCYDELLGMPVNPTSWEKKYTVDRQTERYVNLILGKS